MKTRLLSDNSRAVVMLSGVTAATACSAIHLVFLFLLTVATSVAVIAMYERKE